MRGRRGGGKFGTEKGKAEFGSPNNGLTPGLFRGSGAGEAHGEEDVELS